MELRGVLDVIALVAQLSGLHAIMIITLAAHLLRIPQCEAECAKLEGCARKLHELVQWRAPATQLPAMAARALVDADGLVGSYRGSALWCRVRTARSMEARFMDMQHRVNCLCLLVLGLHANLLAVHPPSDNNATNHHVTSDPSASDSQRYNGTGQGEADDQSDNAEPGGFESV